jgi:hypothetical protein
MYFWTIHNQGHKKTLASLFVFVSYIPICISPSHLRRYVLRLRRRKFRRHFVRHL